MEMSRYQESLVHQILWENIRSRRSYCLGRIFFNLILIFLVAICSTPGESDPSLEGN